MGAGRKEKYLAWKLGGARAYTMAAKKDRFLKGEVSEQVRVAQDRGGSKSARELMRKRERHTFVTINLFTCWFTVLFIEKSPNYVRKAILCTMKESLKIGLPSDGRFT
jgi:hypothetical protein